MYYPYFRGKQFELLAIRECAETITSAGFTPIIEPVRESFNGLRRALTALQNAGARAIVITNPQYGELRDDEESISKFLADEFGEVGTIVPGVLIRDQTSVAEVPELLSKYEDSEHSILHSGFTDPHRILESTGDNVLHNIFIDKRTTALYRKHFSGRPRVLIRDGFEQRRNADYPLTNNFSDLHATFKDLEFDGYGDFLTIGDSYSEGGGPAYAVAIHLTYISADHDNSMFIYHFISDSNDTPTDPAGKFYQALSKLVEAFQTGISGLLETSAIRDFQDLHKRKHFPGLGYIKKLSIIHHLETLANYHNG